MSNIQPLSPQGYNIKDEPYNTNPFWGDDGNVDPSLYTRVAELENDVADLESGKADKSELNDYYTKTEITDIVNNIPLFDSTLYDTKSQVNTKINNAKIDVLDSVASLYYNKTETDNKLSTKANITAFNDYYNKTTIDDLLDGIDEDIEDVEAVANQASSDVSDMSSTVTDLSSAVTANTGDIASLTTRVGNAEGNITTLQTDKADKINTYTKTEVDDKIDVVNAKILNKSSVVYNSTYVYDTEDTEFKSNLDEGQWFLMDSANHESYNLCHTLEEVEANDTMVNGTNWEYWTIEQELIQIKSMFANYYTKQEVYDKTEVYTKAEVDALIQGDE